MLYPTLDAPAPSSWNSADASSEQSSIAQRPLRIPGAGATGGGSRLLRSNPLYDAPGIAGPGASTGQASTGPMTWQQPSWGAMPASQHSTRPTSPQAWSPSRSGSASGGGGTSGGYSASGSASEPGGWAGALAASSGELESIARSAEGIARHLRSNRTRRAAPERTPEWAESSEPAPAAGLGSEAPLPDDPIDPNPPLPPDPVPVDGGLMILALAGGAYGLRRLRAADVPA